jgi:hypothetical protein
MQFGSPSPQRDSEPVFGRRDDEPAPVEHEPEPQQQEAIATTATVIDHKEEAKTDLDMPAFLRRERRLFQ